MWSILNRIVNNNPAEVQNTFKPRELQPFVLDKLKVQPQIQYKPVAPPSTVGIPLKREAIDYASYQMGVPINTIDESGANIIKGSESFRNKAYKPVKGDHWTIGYGTPAKYPGEVITKEEGLRRFRNALSYYHKRINDTLNINYNNTSIPYNQKMYNAIISFTYNSGVGGSRKVRKLLQQGNIDDAIAEWSKHIHAGGKVLPGLEKRRNLEINLFREGWEEQKKKVDRYNRYKALQLMQPAPLSPSNYIIRARPNV